MISGGGLLSTLLKLVAPGLILDDRGIGPDRTREAIPNGSQRQGTVKIARSGMNANSEVPGKTGTTRVARNLLLNSWEGGITHETPIRFVVLAVGVHRLRSRRLCGGRRAASRRSRCSSAVHLGRSRLLRGRVLQRLSGAWILRASSASLAVVAARSAGRCSDGGARCPGRRRGSWLPVSPWLHFSAALCRSLPGGAL